MWFTNRIAALILRWFAVLFVVLAGATLYQTFGNKILGIPADLISLAVVALTFQVSLLSFLAAGWALERGGPPTKREVLIGWLTWGGTLCAYLSCRAFHPLVAISCFLVLGAVLFFCLAIFHPDRTAS